MFTMRFWNNQVIGKPNNLKVDRSKTTKEPKQDSQIRPRSPMPEDIVERMTGTTKRK